MSKLNNENRIYATLMNILYFPVIIFILNTFSKSLNTNSNFETKRPRVEECGEPVSTNKKKEKGPLNNPNSKTESRNVLPFSSQKLCPMNKT